MKKNQKVLFLDDNPKRIASFKVRMPTAFVAVRAADAINILKNQGRKSKKSPIGEWDMLFLDQNLWRNGGKDTGMEVVEWVLANKPIIKQVFIHSHDMPASIRMEQKLKAAGYSVVAEPYWLFDPLEALTGKYQPQFDRKRGGLSGKLSYRQLD